MRQARWQLRNSLLVLVPHRRTRQCAVMARSRIMRYVAGHHPEIDDRLDRHRDGLNAHADLLAEHHGKISDLHDRVSALEGHGEPDADDPPDGDGG